MTTGIPYDRALGRAYTPDELVHAALVYAELGHWEPAQALGTIASAIVASMAFSEDVENLVDQLVNETLAKMRDDPATSAGKLALIEDVCERATKVGKRHPAIYEVLNIIRDRKTPEDIEAVRPKGYRRDQQPTIGHR